MSARDDYKRCICDIFGSGEADCPFKSSEDDQTDETVAPDEEETVVPDEEEEETVVPDEEEEEETVVPDEEEEDEADNNSDDFFNPDNGHEINDDEEEEEESSESTGFEELEQIKADPHYADGSVSRTLYQVDREMDFIELKLREMFAALQDADMIQ